MSLDRIGRLIHTRWIICSARLFYVSCVRPGSAVRDFAGSASFVCTLVLLLIVMCVWASRFRCYSSFFVESSDLMRKSSILRIAPTAVVQSPGGSGETLLAIQLQCCSSGSRTYCEGGSLICVSVLLYEVPRKEPPWLVDSSSFCTPDFVDEECANYCIVEL